MLRRRSPGIVPPDAEPATAAVYDWGRFGRHRLRAPDGAIIDLPVSTAGATAVWVATVWPDPHVPGGWARQIWAVHPTSGGGWRLPLQLAAGDVLEFGADKPSGPVRWYGIMDAYEVDRWATVQGPYPRPAAAYEDAQRLLALERFQPAIRPEPRARPRQLREVHRRCRRRHRRGP